MQWRQILQLYLKQAKVQKVPVASKNWVFFQWMWEYMYSYCYFRYHQNMNFQQVLPKAFAKSLKTKEMVTRVCLCSIASKACSKKAKLPLTDYKKHWKYEMSQETQWASSIIKPLKSEAIHETGLSGNVVTSFFPLIIFIYIYINIYIYIYRMLF